jgi:hypothetical protein
MDPNDKEALRARVHMLNPAAWVLDNEFINENQKPFEFTKHRFMLQPYADSSPDQVIMKSAQVGWSVAAILKSIHAAYFLKLNIIYVLPTRNVVNDFVTPKVNPMIERNKVIRDMMKGSDSTSLKKVGDRFIYFRGSFHEGEAISTTADLIVADEYDRSDQGVLTVYQSRLQASDYGWFWRFSNPSVPGFGVHELYQDSDQMHWFVRCTLYGWIWSNRRSAITILTGKIKFFGVVNVIGSWSMPTGRTAFGLLSTQARDRRVAADGAIGSLN